MARVTLTPGLIQQIAFLVHNYNLGLSTYESPRSMRMDFPCYIQLLHVNNGNNYHTTRCNLIIIKTIKYISGGFFQLSLLVGGFGPWIFFFSPPLGSLILIDPFRSTTEKL